ncbi:MAG: TonB-dependent receptor [Tannerella sp.]|jgi:TonB-linked SusC/RagA family outer membrane protein|nr:TonB-dependent receptor [Tannerella sp.]
MNDKIFVKKNALWKMIIAVCVLCCTFSLYSQKTVSGTVTDVNDEPIVGATVSVKGTSNGTTTDTNGAYRLNVQENAILVFSYIGYVAQEVTVTNQTEISVRLREDLQNLDEIVVVGYGTQRKSTLTGSVSAISSEQLTITPIGNVTNALTGKLPGLITVQSSGMPGSDHAILNIRGFGSPLVIVDGIEASMTDLDPNQIETVSILKDGAASIYGARAGNGVLLVTTKRGILQKPSITFNTSLTLQGVTNLAKTISSGQWAQLRREEHLNAGLPEETAPFTAEEVEKYFAGNDPAYPSSDWYHFVFKDWAPQQNHNMSIRGGNEKLRYLGFFGYQKQETMIKENGGDFSRYNMQSNVDAAITSRINLSVDLSAAYEDRNFAQRVPHDYYWQDLYGTQPWYPTTFPDPTKLPSGGIDVGSVAMTSNMNIIGYDRKKFRDLRGSITLSYDLPFIEGLKAKAFVNYRDWETQGKEFVRPYEWYTYNWEADVYTRAGGIRSTAEASESFDLNKQLTQQYSLNYDHTFNNVHHVTGLVMLESIDYSYHYLSAGRREFLTPAIEELFAGSTATQTNYGSAQEWGRASMIGRINYSYKDKYLLETILRADASAKFPEEKRWGYFPSISLGWVISQEGFMQNASIIEFLKLRTSYGSSGNDGVGNFQYLAGFQIDGMYQWADEFVSGLTATGMANPLLTWEKMSVYNGGLDFSISNRMIYGTIDVFYRKRDGIPTTRNISLPSTFGARLPTENINSLNDRGFEISLGTAKRGKDFTYDISGNISWSRAKWDHYEEPDYEDPDQKRLYQRSGQWTDRVMGYVSDGVFTSQEEIDALTYEYTSLGGGNSLLRPGDVKIKDINNDGKLDWKDQQEIGKGNTPHWFYGLNANITYKGFDIIAMFQGAFGYSTTIAGYYGTTDTYYKLRWTETNNHKDVLIARPGGVSRGDGSDYVLRPTSYLRLKNASLGYTLPKQWTSKVGIDKLRLYISGTNLFTLSTLSKYYIDPEVPSGQIHKYYPQQRTISFGLNINFNNK